MFVCEILGTFPALSTTDAKWFQKDLREELLRFFFKWFVVQPLDFIHRVLLCNYITGCNVLCFSG